MADTQWTILMVDDDPGDVEFVRRHLNLLKGVKYEVLSETDLRGALRAIVRDDIDFILVDYLLGASTGLDVIKAIRNIGDMRPIVALTGQGDEYVAAELIEAGADQYIAKADLTPDHLLEKLALARARSLRRVSDHEDRRRRDRVINELTDTCSELAIASSVDSLTQVLNRGSWSVAAHAEHERSLRTGESYGLLMIDIDHFKMLNDALGHQAGDQALRQMGKCLWNSCRSYDLVGRYGGEEFVVLASSASGHEIEVIVERFQSALAAMNIRNPGAVEGGCLTVSIGVAFGPMATVDAVIGAADQALYAAKRAGRNRVVYAPRPEAVAGGGTVGAAAGHDTCD